MSCNPELVSAFLDGELDAIALKTVAKHLMRCNSCCKTLSRLVQVRDALADHITIADPEAMTKSIMVAIQNEHILPLMKGCLSPPPAAKASSSGHIGHTLTHEVSP